MNIVLYARRFGALFGMSLFFSGSAGEDEEEKQEQEDELVNKTYQKKT